MARNILSTITLAAALVVVLALGACQKTAPPINWDETFEPPPQVTLAPRGPAPSPATDTAPQPAKTAPPPAITPPSRGPGQTSSRLTPPPPPPGQRPTVIPAPPSTSPGQVAQPSPAPTARVTPPPAPRPTSSKVSSSLYFLMHLRRSSQANQIPEIKGLLEGIERKGGVEVNVVFGSIMDDERLRSLETQFAGTGFQRIDGRIVQTGTATYEATVPFDLLTPLAAAPDVLSIAPAAGVRSALMTLGH